MKLVVLDVDNTLFDWVDYYVHAFGASLECVSKKISIPVSVLAQEAKEVFDRHSSIEYPFVIQELPSVNAHYGDDIDSLLDECVAPARDEFRAVAVQKLRPYEGVVETLQKIYSSDRPIVALTDAPRYVAMWKLNKLGLLNFFDAVYGLSDPKIPTDERLHRVKVDAKILLKHLQQYKFGFEGKIRILPDEYEKPGLRGLKTVLMDYDLDDSKEHRSDVLWVGDNLKKDVKLGKTLGVVTAWAEYGTRVSEDLMSKLKTFSPERNVHKNASIIPSSKNSQDQLLNPDITLGSFSEIVLKINN